MNILYLVFGLIVTALIPLSLLGLVIFVAKKVDEYSIIKNDRKLKKLKWEIKNEDNDGWSKLHYKKLYQKRKKQLKDSINMFI
jgi:hypothetical protein